MIDLCLHDCEFLSMVIAPGRQPAHLTATAATSGWRLLLGQDPVQCTLDPCHQLCELVCLHILFHVPLMDSRFGKFVREQAKGNPFRPMQLDWSVHSMQCSAVLHHAVGSAYATLSVIYHK